MCPECIANGAAAKKIHGEFQQDTFNDENVVNEEYRDEILHRTPSYMSWQGSNWPAHCYDYCEFLGNSGWDKLEKLGVQDSFENFTDGIKTNESVTEEEIIKVESQLGFCLSEELKSIFLLVYKKINMFKKY